LNVRDLEGPPRQIGDAVVQWIARFPHVKRVNLQLWIADLEPEHLEQELLQEAFSDFSSYVEEEVLQLWRKTGRIQDIMQNGVRVYMKFYEY